MNFTQFKKKLDQIECILNPGSSFQMQMSPPNRDFIEINDAIIENSKKASVLMLFYPDKNNNTQFILTKRASYKGTHSAQISFPGGKTEKGDATFAHTALRETEEEIGVQKEEIVVFREMTQIYIPPSNFLVYPFLGYLDYEPEFAKSNEVDEILIINFDDLLTYHEKTKIKLDTSYAQKISVPYYKLNNYTTWGATAMMLSEIKELFNSL